MTPGQSLVLFANFDMKTHLAHWTIKTTHGQRDRIDPRPQFQRGEVWKTKRKQLLIDSVLRGYDVPKIYLSKSVGNPHHDYEVCDGQQRLITFWDFIDDKFALGEQSSDIRGHDLRGKTFSELPMPFRRLIERFKLVIAILENASSDEKRALFARLQMGVVLTPPELRNAIASAIGSFINTVVETHDFFLQSNISRERFKRQDFLAHALALSIYNNSEDLKASLLTKLYEDHPTNYDKVVAQRTTEILEWLHSINQRSSWLIATKWGFVDLFWLLWRRNGDIKTIDVDGFAASFKAFEEARRLHNKEPEVLLTEKPTNKPLYDYIQAFNTSGSIAERIEKRHSVVAKQFHKYIIT